MKKIILLLVIFLSFGFFCLNAFANLEPSENSCSYYSQIESQIQCGNKSYLAANAYPQCLYYLNISKYLTFEIQTWFPKIRYCLQKELEQNLNEITCDNIYHYALQSHVNCYISLGFCELSVASKLQLSLITLPKLKEKIWYVTAKAINEACLKK